MKHLVLGSSGQIGSHLVKYLQNQGEEVFTFDIVDNEFDDLRVSNSPRLNVLMEHCDFVHFLAFDVGGAKYLEQYQDSYNFISNNLKIMANTFDKIREYNKPFLFASSQMSEMSYSTYGVLKDIGERATRSLGGVITRFWNVYGYENDEEKSHVITDFIKMAKYEGKINMRTNGKESRQFLHADDCSECLYTISKRYKTLDKSKSYHVTNYEWATVLDIAKEIQKISSCSIIPNEREDQTQKNAMNPPNENVLEFWKPNITLSEGIKGLYKLY